MFRRHADRNDHCRCIALIHANQPGGHELHRFARTGSTRAPGAVRGGMALPPALPVRVGRGAYRRAYPGRAFPAGSRGGPPDHFCQCRGADHFAALPDHRSTLGPGRRGDRLCRHLYGDRRVARDRGDTAHGQSARNHPRPGRGRAVVQPRGAAVRTAESCDHVAGRRRAGTDRRRDARCGGRRADRWRTVSAAAARLVRRRCVRHDHRRPAIPRRQRHTRAGLDMVAPLL